MAPVGASCDLCIQCILLTSMSRHAGVARNQIRNQRNNGGDLRVTEKAYSVSVSEGGSVKIILKTVHVPAKEGH